MSELTILREKFHGLEPILKRENFPWKTYNMVENLQHDNVLLPSTTDYICIHPIAMHNTGG